MRDPGADLRSAVLLTATDTGVGKTFVACGIARALRAAEFDVGVSKPFASGAVVSGGRRTHGDVEALMRAAGSRDPFEIVCPCLFRDPLAPSVAAPREGARVDLARAARAVREIARRHDVTVVEGAGGLLAPLTRRVTVADFARRLGLPVLVVARPALGTLNHTRLTVEAARARGLAVLGVVVNHARPGRRGLAERTNTAALRGWCGAPVLGEIPHGAGPAAFARLARTVFSGLQAPLPAKMTSHERIESP
jgi:dethiobiotin synthetase